MNYEGGKLKNKDKKKNIRLSKKLERTKRYSPNVIRLDKLNET